MSAKTKRALRKKCHYEHNKDAKKLSVQQHNEHNKYHTATLGNSSYIIQDNCGSCNPVLVMSLREWNFSIELLCLIMYFPVLYFSIQSKTSH